MQLELERQDDAYLFTAQNEAGHEITLDTSLEEDGEEHGVGAMQVVAIGLGHCSSVDVISILKKQKQTIQGYRVTVDAERAHGETPAVFRKIHLHYYIDGKVKPLKAERAINLSLGKYCSVARMLEKTAEITYSLTVNGEAEATNCSYEQKESQQRA
jgi:putative redox protein